MKTSWVASFFMIFLMIAVTAVFYSALPNTVVSHWDSNSEPNGFMPKAEFIALFLGITIIIFLLLLFLPKADPMKENYVHFQKYYDFMIFVVMLFMFYVYGLSIAANLGIKISIGTFLLPAFALLFYYLGILLEKTRRNWFVGIRTPWSLSSDAVWEKTHKFGARIFKLFALIMILTGIVAISLKKDAESPLFMAFIAEAIIAICIPVFYSYYIFTKEKTGKKQAKKQK